MTVKVKTKMTFDVQKLFMDAWHELMYGGHILSLGASATVLSVVILMGKEPSLTLLIIPYLIAQLVYALNRRKDLKSDFTSNPERTQHMLRTRSFFVSSIYIYTALIVLMLFVLNNITTAMLVMLVLVLGILYPKDLTRRVVGFKNYYVSILWTLAFVSMPFVYYEVQINSLYVFMFVFVLLRAMLNTIFFDLKDTQVDKSKGLKTMPVVIGYNNTLLLLTFCNILSGLVLLFAIYLGVMDVKASILLLSVHYSFYYLFLAYKSGDESRIRKISYVMVDGEYVFWPLLLLAVGLV
jgi:4-hydroxybenzoate polyprenyltransferase